MCWWLVSNVMSVIHVMNKLYSITGEKLIQNRIIDKRNFSLFVKRLRKICVKAKIWL